MASPASSQLTLVTPLNIIAPTTMSAKPVHLWLTSCVFGARPSMWGFRLLGRRKEMIFFSCDESLKPTLIETSVINPSFCVICVQT